MVVRALAAVERSRVALILVDATVGFTEPVSYTHLDVYKRQVHRSAPMATSTTS